MSVDYARAEARPSLARRARRRPALVVVAVLFVVVIVLLVWSSKPQDYTAFSPENTAGDGARAAAEILRTQGVEVRKAESLGSTRIGDPATTTLVIAEPHLLQEFQVEALLDYPGDLVTLGVDDATLRLANTGLVSTYADATTVSLASCRAEDALAAQQVEAGPWGVSGTPAQGVTTCFPTDRGAATYVDLERDAGRLTILASPEIVTNDRLAQEGNAALTLRTLGRHPSVVWYVADGFDSSVPTWEGGDGIAPPEAVPVSPDFLPPGTLPAAFALGLAVLVTAMWRARRFGPLVREPLPVVVRASEATRGRARLYRRARAAGRAGAAMRAHAARNIGPRLGVPRTAGADALVDAICRATGRNRADVTDLLYGPPPASDADLMTLTTELDRLESEVHRP
ncbi:DUF4350 domain-containing protein [Demequina sp. NBRC 110051]|uniref:DUF4350 domain-containing protein n=1 Tax=Demequina sp. NBRC 110051 TaxID=1570340 RepID=UPI0009FD4CF5|nr:DUF4350 domain-containing protein [Demequina sp. NBRC 110051]